MLPMARHRDVGDVAAAIRQVMATRPQAAGQPHAPRARPRATPSSYALYRTLYEPYASKSALAQLRTGPTLGSIAVIRPFSTL